MPSTPLIASSIGVATVSAMTFGLAPGYCARTTTEGGTTSGYSEIGMTRSASRPASKMSTDSTPAKIGRSMKNLDKFMGAAPRECRIARSALCDVRRTLRLPRLSPSMATSSGATRAPGRTRCSPFTMMRSPGFRPFVTTRRPSTNAPSVTSR